MDTLHSELYCDSQVSNWHKIGELPAHTGKDSFPGIAAAFYGSLGDYLIIAGGTNFPDGHPFFNGSKKNYESRGLIYSVADGDLALVKTFELPEPSGYGATVKHENSLYFVGGANEKGFLNSVIKVALEKDGTPNIQKLPPLPLAWSDGGAAVYDDRLYLFGGKVNGEAINDVISVPLHGANSNDVIKHRGIPGTLTRTSFPSIKLGKGMYIFGGLYSDPSDGKYVLADSYRFDFITGEWKALSDITLDGLPYSVLGASAVQLGPQSVLLLGGVNYEIFNDTLAKLSNLKGEALSDFKKHYFSQPPDYYQFSRVQMEYRTDIDRWLPLNSKLPFNGGAGPVQVIRSGEYIYHFGGEIKPVARTPDIYRGEIGR
ncbi:hypothetical protein HGD86_02725 [Alteromonadaceae bacterium A_SAG5]|nr:hypothetical protein [Alteromonadaceae bacterium A_SAG6]NKX18075.1 hypothetical protein [Alteromonadaceae bacterium A_SAG5]NKX19290.1 hypothetical protein [Alteromonadaceae bacterium A_SAG8]NKX35084.1 hypothetical protein [Alteromonadaceae bacterium A_SAG3]NKX69074.1 hypothetical protein [Alteromonadaceae bacterium A_SAG7]